MERNICRPGMIVQATAGRDAGRYFLVTGTENTLLLLADGKRRLLSRPKRKNPLHVQATNQKASVENLTDRALRTLLQPLNEGANRPQTMLNQIRKEVIEDVETGCN